jgi:hypothetical protein
MRRHHTTFGAAGAMLVLLVFFGLAGLSSNEGQGTHAKPVFPTRLQPSQKQIAKWRQLHGWTVAYTVPPASDEEPACATGWHFVITRVAIGRQTARVRRVHGVERYRVSQQAKPVTFDGEVVFDESDDIATVEGYCQK